MSGNLIKGFKVFNPDWTCRDFHYEVGKVYAIPIEPIVCGEGFHFCKRAIDCFNYYPFDPKSKVAEVIALGKIAEGGDKCATNKIEIVREISWAELLGMVNSGAGNTGHSNSGDRNSGDWNKSSYNAGCFNTKQHKLRFFDKETNVTMKEWLDSDARYLLNKIVFSPTEWVCSNDMSDEEKERNPEYATTGGYLRKRDNSKACIEWWDELSEYGKSIIRAIPNFDAVKFYEITGIRA